MAHSVFECFKAWLFFIGWSGIELIPGRIKSLLFQQSLVTYISLYSCEIPWISPPLLLACLLKSPLIWFCLYSHFKKKQFHNKIPDILATTSFPQWPIDSEVLIINICIVWVPDNPLIPALCPAVVISDGLHLMEREVSLLRGSR